MMSTIKPSERYFLCTVLLLLFNCCLAQDSTTLLLQSWNKPSRLAKIRAGQDIDITLKITDTLSPGRTVPTLYSGTFSGAGGGRLRLAVDYEEQRSKSASGTIAAATIMYEPAAPGRHMSPESRQVDYNKIQSISYTNQPPVSDIGFFVAGMSVVTALVVAPLISVNYKTGEFKENRYYKTLGGCAIGFTIGFPLGLAFMKSKTYEIRQHGAHPDGEPAFKITSP